jgi:putative transposase
MPKRNSIKIYGAEQYYHLYNRGANKQIIFHEPSDYYYFLSLFKRHLSAEQVFDRSGRPFNKYNDQVELVAYCLMPNHFHVLCYLKDPAGINNLMRSAMTAYTMYFNKKYNRSGTLCEGVFLASRITNDAYLWHITRYIHLNPMDLGVEYADYPYSSLPYFTGDYRASWVAAHRLVTTDKDQMEYVEFVADYKTMHNDMKLLKNLLA